MLISILSVLLFFGDGNRSRNAKATTDEASTTTVDDTDNYSSDSSSEISWINPIENDLYMKPLDINKSLKKFTSPNAMNVIRALYMYGPLNFSQLMDKTGLSKNILNHTLYELKNEELVILRNKTYDITNYSVTLLEGLDSIVKALKQSAKGDLFNQRVKRDNNA
jgi:DNA-binding HxlR family transcriptional regulator